VKLFSHFQGKLMELRRSPSRDLVEGMLEDLKEFLRNLGDGIDDDFFTAFAYRADGSLYGDLWRMLPDATWKIFTTLQERRDGRKDWIKDAVQHASQLERHRRARVKALHSPSAAQEVHSKVDGCACDEKWSAWVWFGALPRKTPFAGCSQPPSEGRISGVSADWAGFCKVHQLRHSLVKCREKFAQCDPGDQQGQTQNLYRIWRAGDISLEQVTLPLLQMDGFLHLDIRSARADFCTPNFAPLLIERNWYWSMNSWIPWELKRTTCWGARLHPPGASVLVTRCSRRGTDEKAEADVEWEIIGKVYLVSYYNTWGTSDGDMLQSWFDGSWASESWADKGWLNVADGWLVCGRSRRRRRRPRR